MSVAYDGLGNSPWDAIWYDGEDEDLDVLDCEMRVGAVWRPPLVRVEKRERRPAIYGFQLRFAMGEAACKQLSSLLGDTVEFLPLRVKRKTPLFVMHPMLRVDLDEKAVVGRNSVSGNITVIHRHRFVEKQFEEGTHVFQLRQAPGSAARDAGYPCSGVYVSSEFKSLCEANVLPGVAFENVCSQ